MISLIYHEIVSLNDPLLFDWLDAVQTNFPPDEQMLASFYLRFLVAKSEGDDEALTYRMLAVLNAEDQSLIGAVLYQTIPELSAVYLWYLLVAAKDQRGQGLGTAFYTEIVRRANEEIPDLKAIVLEVERPDQALSDEQCIESEQRIRFYRRLGVQIATNLTYYQSLDRPDQKPKLMYVCIHPLRTITDEDKYQLSLSALGNGIVPNTSISWE